eukprot:TRINITY_DN779905_c0_g1_i1.p1 TRINITY_DN779905_c0_g1~~TRINITY_DN779905_c0_g1_i1.p1  ORF type:complete len:186 (-),score=65.53 TRINITY_DN779905_c0_g1_i1:146-703(-)
MPQLKSTKILRLIDYKLRFTILDGRDMIGTFMAFDKHMNVILGDCEEVRRVKTKTGYEDKTRPMGLMILRGEQIVSYSIEDTPNRNETLKLPTQMPAPGPQQPPMGAAMPGMPGMPPQGGIMGNMPPPRGPMAMPPRGGAMGMPPRGGMPPRPMMGMPRGGPMGMPPRGGMQPRPMGGMGPPRGH